MKKAVVACIVAALVLSLLGACDNSETLTSSHAGSSALSGASSIVSDDTSGGLDGVSDGGTADGKGSTVSNSGECAAVSNGGGTGSAGNDPSGSVSYSAENVKTFSASVNGIPFGLTPEELLQTLREKGLELKPADNSLIDNIEIIDDGRQYSPANGSFTYETTDGVLYQYDEDGIFDGFYVDTPDVPTAEGLRVGDSTEELEALYGKNFASPIGSLDHREFTNGSEYLLVSIQNGKVWSWSINKTPM